MNMKLQSRAAAALLMMILSGCATVRVLPLPDAAAVPDAAAMAAELARVQSVRSVSSWGFSGRVAVSNGRDGGNGRLDWRSSAAGYHARLSAPVTRHGWELDVDAGTGQARLDGLAGGSRQGADARALVHGATGWDLPVDELGDWVRGLVDAGAGGIERDIEGRPLRASQHGWDVQFSQWYPAEGAQPPLPRRIDAVHGQARVRLLVDQWTGWQP